MRFVMRIVVTAIALWAATRLVSGITYQGNWIGLAGVALVFGLLNSFVRPILSFLAFPLLIVTLGLFTFVLNALMLLLTSALSSTFGFDFHVAGFAAAFWGAIVTGIVSFLLSMFLPDGGRERDEDLEAGR
ncbi:MAG: phage holin family protein [Gemmatimonadota bacterium]